MDQADGFAEGRVRKRRSVTEKRRIVELTLQPGASVALVTRSQGVNANQVFAWRRAFERGELTEPSVAPGGFLAVTSAGHQAAPIGERAASLIHVEFPGHALLSIGNGADPTLLRVLLESLRR